MLHSNARLNARLNAQVRPKVPRIPKAAKDHGPAKVGTRNKPAPAVAVPVPEPPPTIVGKMMEVQTCTPEVCDFLCGVCAWEACEVLAQCGEKSYNVRLCADDKTCDGVLGRFLRFTGEKRKRC